MAVRRMFSYMLLSLLVAATFALLVLCIKAVLSEKLDLEKYSPNDEGRYLALPYSGGNFKAASMLSYGMGREYLLGRTAATVVHAYELLEQRLPGLEFLYGESGWKGGGKFWPHRTHKHGLSIDFITPMYVLDGAGNKLPKLLGSNILNLWTYRIRLDEQGRYKDYHLDVEAMIAHIAALKEAAPQYGLRIERIIFDPHLMPLLRKSASFASIKDLYFMQERSWFPHDGHYHIDFAKLD